MDVMDKILKQVHDQKVTFVRENMKPGYNKVEVKKKAIEQKIYSAQKYSGANPIELLIIFERIHRKEIWAKGKPLRKTPVKKKESKPATVNTPKKAVEKVSVPKPEKEVKTIDEIDSEIQKNGRESKNFVKKVLEYADKKKEVDIGPTEEQKKMLDNLIKKRPDLKLMSEEAVELYDEIDKLENHADYPDVDKSDLKFVTALSIEKENLAIEAMTALRKAKEIDKLIAIYNRWI